MDDIIYQLVCMHIKNLYKIVAKNTMLLQKLMIVVPPAAKSDGN